MNSDRRVHICAAHVASADQRERYCRWAVCYKFTARTLNAIFKSVELLKKSVHLQNTSTVVKLNSLPNRLSNWNEATLFLASVFYVNFIFMKRIPLW